ncbi:MAG: RpiB/LacA/LacB family sugar-phosphate isomerase, partial [Bacilli bacterium]|nr:RpiB/LacA/LacB family sugar-phosphate isomerase [Bacilli bacterium]
VPSANVSGEKPAANALDAKGYFEGKAAFIIDGKISSNIPSTIVLIKDGNISLVRQGVISYDELKETYENAKMTISLGSDHGGFLQKEKIKDHLAARGFGVLDFGTDSLASCDYPIFGKQAAQAVMDGKSDLGIVVCTSGEGISIAANKVPGIRCGIGYDDVVTQKMREHNNANVIAFGAKYMKDEDVLRRVDIFLSEKFSVEAKHHRRVDAIE